MDATAIAPDITDTKEAATAGVTQTADIPKVESQDIGGKMAEMQRIYREFFHEYNTLYPKVEDALGQNMSAASGTGLEQFESTALNIRKLTDQIKQMQAIKPTTELNAVSQQLLRDIKLDANIKVAELLRFTMRAAPMAGPMNLSGALRELISTIDIKIPGIDA